MGRTENSVAEALGQAHAALLADLRELEQAVCPSREEGLAELHARLGAAHAHITKHFRFEEQNGYMDAVRKREPRLERTVLHLAEEHRQLAQALDALVQEAETAVGPDSGFDERIRAWVDRLRQHEARENELFQNAFNLDIGAED